MDIRFKKLKITSAILMSLPLMYGSAIYAAKPINLRHQSTSALHTLTAYAQTKNGIAVKEISRHVDAKKTLHIRMQQTYLNYPIWGADAVLHIPNGNQKTSLSHALGAGKNQSMNGIFYQNLNADLAYAPAVIFTQEQAQKALQHSLDNYQHAIGSKVKVSQEQSQLMVFVDEANKAHWAYKVSFLSPANKLSKKPVRWISIIDANTLNAYMSWDDIKTEKSKEVDGGGFGGNIKMGKMVYDGLKKDLAKLLITRNDQSKTCYLQNSDVIVVDTNTDEVMDFNCKATNDKHNDVYWDADFDKVNDGYSPGNDALFGGQVIKHLYKDWYGVPVLTNADNSPMLLKMVVHLRDYDNAYWNGKEMTFGDGESMFYPLTSLGVAAHEISHGFTEQHSNLTYRAQSGGINESFSDMAAQAAEVYAYGPGKNSWQIGPEIIKAKDQALRYMDLPSKDCSSRSYQCSIDDATQYRQGLDVHYSSGVFNRLFYTLGTTKGWDVRKTFDVMVNANSNYWTSDVNFKEAACGVISAAKDLKYSTDDVKAALDVVKVDYSDC